MFRIYDWTSGKHICTQALLVTAHHRNASAQPLGGSLAEFETASGSSLGEFLVAWEKQSQPAATGFWVTYLNVMIKSDLRAFGGETHLFYSETVITVLR